MTLDASETPQDVKARGAFYTPAAIASFIARWAVRAAEDRVLEPACGDGAFMTAAAARYRELGRTDLRDRLVGAERSPVEAAKAASLVPSADVRTVSFFDLDPGDLPERVEAVIGNPPYIRYHGFTGEERTKGLARANAVGVQLTRLASSWAHFVIHATAFLAPGGRLGLVLPAELLVTDYARPVRAHLLARFSSLVIIAFDRMVFDGAQVDAVLLLASNDSDDGLRFLRVRDAAALAQLDPLLPSEGTPRPAERWSASLDLDAEALYGRLVASSRSCRLSDFASVDIGVVTGANRFFIMSAEEGVERGLPDALLVPIVERPSDVPGLSVRDAELKRLLLLPSGPPPDDPALATYLRQGHEMGVDRGYKCRVRKYWHSVPVPRKRPDAFLPYMSGGAPRLIVNEHRAWSTNLVHGVTFTADAPAASAAAAAMLSSMTLLSAEVEGRPYGGGVLKLETRESERLLVPRLTGDEEAVLVRAFPELDELVRQGQLPRASRLVDAILGIDADTLNRARDVFRSRRQERGARARN